MKQALFGGLFVFLFVPSAALAAVDGPTVIVSSTLSSPTNQSTIPVAVVFSSPVTGFSASSPQITGPATINTSSFIAVSGAEYSFSLTATADGTITVTIPADVATDSSGKGNQTAQFSIEYETARPHIALSPSTLSIPTDDPFVVDAETTADIV